MSTLVKYFENSTQMSNEIDSENIASSETCELFRIKMENRFNTTKNKEIIKNMEEVLNNVKKKSKHKHEANRKLKHHKHCSKSNKGDASISESLLKEKSSNYKKKSSSLTKLNSSTKQNVTKKIGLINSEQKRERNTKMNLNLSENQINATEQTKTVNAFEFLMGARNKSIGGNSPGKDENNESLADLQELDLKKKTNSKRKLMLEEWANRKGAKKRKIEEAAREQYIEEQMDKRAFRLKNLLEKQSKTDIKLNKSKARKNEKIKNSNTNIGLEEPFEITKVDNQKIATRKSTRNNTNINKKENEKKPEQKADNKNQFIAKLASPIKKRDSLLGYFEKKTPSPSTESNKNNSNSNSDVKHESSEGNISLKNKRRKKNESDNCCQTPLSNRNSEVNEFLNSTPISLSRPKRSCVGKIRYDLKEYELELSPEKSKNHSKSNKSNNIKPKIQTSPDTANESSDVIIIDDSIEVKPKKLAPLFVKNIPKPSIDPEIVKARQDFLMSGIPEKMKLEIAKVKEFQENYESMNHLFPKISHIHGWNSNDDTPKVDWKSLNISFRPDDSLESSSISSMNVDGATSRLKKILCVTEHLKPLIPLQAVKPLENKRALVKEWKSIYERFPTYKCYNQLREKYRYFSAMDTAVDTHQVCDSFVVSTRRKTAALAISGSDLNKDTSLLDNVKPPSSAPNGELLFCEKYKPLISDQILVNITPVNQLKEFLSNWQTKNKCVPSDESISSSSFDCGNDTNSMSELPNSIVLVGPISSGKTNAVFALANELNFNVLEINAGMKRSGKKLLQDLHEATQSHQIRKELKNPNALLKKSLSKTKRGFSNGNENSLSSEIGENNTKMSLILVEDADVVFDNCDQGFVDAIYQLVATSKRPVVITANNKKSSHLQRLMNQNCIYFSSPNGLNISKFLTVLSLMENCPIHLDDILSLYYFNKMDLRKTILEMQFFIQSGGDRRLNDDEITEKDNLKSPVKSPSKSFFASPSKSNQNFNNFDDEGFVQDDVKVNIVVKDHKILKKSKDHKELYIHKQLFEFFTISQNFLCKIPYPVNFDLLWTNITEILDVANILNKEEMKVEDKNAISGSQKSIEDLCDFYDKISLASNIQEYQSQCCLVNSIEKEISHFLVEESVSSLINSSELCYNLFDERPVKSEPLSSHIPTINNRSRRAIAVDFEPMLRSICRSEKSKITLKRTTSRHYHYLKNIATNLNSFSTQTFDDVCSIFVDDPINFVELKQPEEKNNWFD